MHKLKLDDVVIEIKGKFYKPSVGILKPPTGFEKAKFCLELKEIK